MPLKVESVLLWIFVNSILHLANSSVVGPAQVEFVGRRIKRSTSTTLVSHKYDVKVTAFGDTHELKLQPSGPIFGPNFRCNQVDVDEHGQTVWTDLTPSGQELSSIEDSIYVDGEKNAAVRIELVDGQINLNGLVNGARIRKRRDNRDHEMEKAEASPGIPATEMKHMKNPEKAVKHARLRTLRATTDDESLRLEPELAFVTDCEFGKGFNFNITAILEYMAITVNAVNSRYGTINNASFHIEFKFVGLHIITDPTAQPFTVKLADKREDASKILQDFSKWAFEHKELLGKYDVCPLMLGNYDGSYDNGFLGRAILGGACDLEGPKGVSNAILFVKDVGGLFIGAFALAHELGHSIGAVDESPFSEATECNSQRYLMSEYYPFGQTFAYEFRLSPCSLALISNFSRSENGSCLRAKFHETSKHTSPLQPGDIADSLQLCKFFHGADAKNPISVQFGVNPDNSCRVQRCEYGNRAEHGQYPYSYITAPGDNTPCGNGGRCRNGWCRNSAPFTLDQVCMIATKNLLAVHYPYEDNDVCKLMQCTKDSNRFYEPLPNPPTGTPCGDNMVCLNQKCTPRSKVPKAEECIARTAKPKATRGHDDTSLLNNGCTTGVKCHYGSEFEYLVEPNHGADCNLDVGGSGVCLDGKCISPIGGRSMSPDNDCIMKTKNSAAVYVAEVTDAGCTSGIKCAFRDQAIYSKPHNNGDNCPKNGVKTGICREGVCVQFVVKEFVVSTETRFTTYLTLGSACADLTGDRKARIYRIKADDLIDRNLFCSSLRCTDENGQLFRAKGHTPNGTVCGGLQRCKNGKCEFCGSSK